MNTKRISGMFLMLACFGLTVFAQTVPPSGIIGWWAGDGDGRDLSGNALHGTPFNSGFVLGRVGQGFDFRSGTGIVPHLRVSDNPLLKPPQFTVEAWVKFNPIFQNYHVIIAKGCSGCVADSYALGFFSNGTNPASANPQFFTEHTLGTNLLAAPGNLANSTVWNHLAGSFDGTTKRLYVNGALVATQGVPQPIVYDANNVPLTVGADWENGVPAYRFTGDIDEATLYNRALLDSEITAIFNAGVGGKIKSAATATGANSQSQVGDQTITFQNVATPGTTSSYSLDPTTLPPLPLGNTHPGLAYEISTTAIYQQGAPNDVRVCFNVPALSSTGFGNNRIFHREGGNWVNRTDATSVYPNLCTTGLTSLSPFAIASAVPTAANVSVGGRVLANGQGVSRAGVTLTDSSGNSRSAMTNAFGYFRFDEVEAGQTYIFTVTHKRYQFAPQVVSVPEEMTELNFTAQ
ncbi:MAG TPA: LamG-like jellyroll fold domain-containing protein [Pyrinomonadaceae bacterium]|nr:LamG-like jellyroll fold domain-containing protein [Pyrinomonadaceae bacterium]